jgi:hypothetical protein
VEAARLIVVCLVALASGLQLVSTYQHKTASEKDPKQQEAGVRLLITDLGDSAYSVREKATARLLEIGLPALDSLTEATEKADLETQTRAAQLIDKIRAKNDLPPLKDGLEFRLTVDKDWVVPELGKSTTAAIKLVITNTKSLAYSFRLYDTVRVVLRDKDGKELNYGGEWRD